MSDEWNDVYKLKNCHNCPQMLMQFVVVCEVQEVLSTLHEKQLSCLVKMDSSHLNPCFISTVWKPLLSVPWSFSWGVESNGINSKWHVNQYKLIPFINQHTGFWLSHKSQSAKMWFVPIPNQKLISQISRAWPVHQLIQMKFSSPFGPR